MNIVVCIKQVPDTSNVKIDSETNNLVREGVPSILNPYDKEALEHALRFRDKAEEGSKVTVISMGPLQAAEALQECLDIGADEALLISDRAVAGSDTLATGYLLSEVIRTLPYDYIFCGSEAIDGCTGQVGPSIATNLGIAQLTYVISAQLEEGILRCTKNIGEYTETCEVEGKAILCFLKDQVNVREKTQSEKKPVILSSKDFPELDMDRIGSKGSPTRVVKIETSGNALQSYVVIDDTLPARERIAMIIAAGVPKNKDIQLIRGTADELAEKISMFPEVANYM